MVKDMMPIEYLKTRITSGARAERNRVPVTKGKYNRNVYIEYTYINNEYNRFISKNKFATHTQKRKLKCSRSL